MGATGAGRQYVVLAQGKGGIVQSFPVIAENKDEAYHQAEIACDWGTLIVLQEKQVWALIKSLTESFAG